MGLFCVNMHFRTTDDEALAPLAGDQSMAGLGQVFPSSVPEIAMTPLLAAVVNKQLGAAERLLDGGAVPNRLHPLFGTPLHAAIGAGEVELLRLLIDRGGDVSARNAQGQTPLEVIEAGRATRERLAQAESLMKSMGAAIPELFEQMPNIALPMEGWDACERLLREHESPWPTPKLTRLAPNPKPERIMVCKLWRPTQI